MEYKNKPDYHQSFKNSILPSFRFFSENRHDVISISHLADCFVSRKNENWPERILCIYKYIYSRKERTSSGNAAQHVQKVARYLSDRFTRSSTSNSHCAEREYIFTSTVRFNVNKYQDVNARLLTNWSAFFRKSANTVMKFRKAYCQVYTEKLFPRNHTCDELVFHTPDFDPVCL